MTGAFDVDRALGIGSRNGSGEKRGPRAWRAPRPSELKAGGAAAQLTLSEWMQSITGMRAPAQVRARDPLFNHPWIFSAAVAIATTAGQAPFRVFRETEDEVSRRRTKAESKGLGPWTPRRGRRRTAVPRHVERSIAQRVMTRALEPDHEHEIAALLARPNPYQRGNQIFVLTALWLAVRQSCFWVVEDEDGDSPRPGELPARIWPLGPDLFAPILEHGSWGDQIEWEFKVPFYIDKNQGTWARITLPMSDVIHIHAPHPENPIEGLSRVAATMLGVELDLLLDEYERALLENDAEPGGMITQDADVVMGPKMEEEFRLKWKEMHEGPYNRRRVAMMPAGLKFTPLQLTPFEMEGQERRKWSRSEHLAVMGAPPSVLGVTDIMNYATQLGQDRNFWDKTILPLMQLVETTLDGTLFFDQPDDVVGLFDLAGIEALRVGVQEKIDMAAKLAGEELHVPPRVAYEVVGLEVPEYEGDDVSLISPLKAPIDLSVPAEPMPEDPPEDPPEEMGDDMPDEMSAGRNGHAHARTAAMGGKRWREFVGLQEQMEGGMKSRYQRWIGQERTAAMKRFDDAVAGFRRARATTRAPVGVVDLDAVLPDLSVSQRALRVRIRPLFSRMLGDVLEFTIDELGGVPVFELDDPRILDVFRARENHLVLRTPKTVRDNLARSLSRGISEGETIQELRDRVAQVYDVSASSAKALQVARTETAGFANSVRDEMFGAQGFVRTEWVTAGDENVRESHQKFGASGPQNRGYNFLEIAGKSGRGTLAYPGDPRAPADEVVNCRCLSVPVE